MAAARPDRPPVVPAASRQADLAGKDMTLLSTDLIEIPPRRLPWRFIFNADATTGPPALVANADLEAAGRSREQEVVEMSVRDQPPQPTPDDEGIEQQQHQHDQPQQREQVDVLGDPDPQDDAEDHQPAPAGRGEVPEVGVEQDFVGSASSRVTRQKANAPARSAVFLRTAIDSRRKRDARPEGTGRASRRGGIRQAVERTVVRERPASFRACRTYRR